MKKALIMVIAIPIVCICGFFLWPKISLHKTADDGLAEVILPNNAIVHARIADDARTRKQGLSGVPALDKFDGMLFVFDAEHRASFWMIDMKFPLDIIYLNKNKEIVEIFRDLPPCINKLSCQTVTSAGPNVQFVLEIAAGEAARQSLGTGQSLLWK
jgi:uncharacterized membrane protein (UPF0127 family)